MGDSRPKPYDGGPIDVIPPSPDSPTNDPLNGIAAESPQDERIRGGRE